MSGIERAAKQAEELQFQKYVTEQIEKAIEEDRYKYIKIIPIKIYDNEKKRLITNPAYRRYQEVAREIRRYERQQYKSCYKCCKDIKEVIKIIKEHEKLVKQRAREQERKLRGAKEIGRAHV